MSVAFADFLPDVIDLASLKLARHHSTAFKKGHTPYDLWRSKREDFETYQRSQGHHVFRSVKHIASFVVSPSGDTLFVGIYENLGLIDPPEGLVVPLSTWKEGEERFYYDLRKTDIIEEYEGRISIDWGKGAINWAQFGTNSKLVTQLTKIFVDESFPGYASFLKLLSEVENLPTTWKQRLQEAKGVYVLSCPTTRELYVGSATGEGGFYDRWRQHAKMSGDAVMFRSREPQDYQVSILEVAGSGASDRDIIHAEHLWMRKLQTNEMGLNGGMLRDGKDKPVTVSASPASAARP